MNVRRLKFFQPRRLTPLRIGLAFAVAVVADGLQLLLGPFGLTFLDEIIDVIAMILEIALLGFHWLLLPTFAVEFIPVADLLPTWTGCVALVVSMRKKNRPLRHPIACWSRENPSCRPSRRFVFSALL